MGIKNPINVIFSGRSGSGKGTQADLLRNRLSGVYGQEVFYINTGTFLRDLTSHEELLTGRLIDEKVMKAGVKAPDALAIWAWTNELIHGINEVNNFILDGSPRTVPEARALDEMFHFYGRTNVFPIFLDVSDEWAYDRMIARGRADDIPENIKNRLAYYPVFVEPIIDYYGNESKNELIRINGEQSIEKVHQDIIKALKL